MKTTTRPIIVPVDDTGTTYLPLYRVLLHNDDVNTMEHVILSLMAVFAFEQRKAERIMREAHERGIALCTVEPFERAEFHQDRLQTLSLIATLEPE